VSEGNGRLQAPADGLYANAQIEDDGPNRETYHEGTYRCSRVGHADCQPDLRSARRAGFPASRVRFPDWSTTLSVRTNRLLSLAGIPSLAVV